MLSKFKKYSDEQLKTALISIDPKITTVDNCQTLLQYLPDNDEFNRAKDYDGKVEVLDQPSRFFVLISGVPNYEARL
jgi:hypothetical protein